MKSALTTYLHDHLAGSRFAVELLQSLHDRYTGEPLGDTAARVQAEVEQDRKVLQGIVDRVGEGSPDLRESVAWLGEKLARWKLGSGSEWSLGTLEAIETIVLGIQGKAALWKVLGANEFTDPRLAGEDYQALGERARAQHDQMEQHRIEVSRAVFARQAS